MGKEYVDIYMIKWKMKQKEMLMEKWRELIKMKEEGRVK